MIQLLLRRPRPHWLEKWLHSWGQEVRPLLRIETYSKAFRARRLHAGPTIFGDLEQLTPRAVELAGGICAQLESVPETRILNAPLRVMHRYELLRALHTSGRNDFEVWLATEQRTPTRFPVFLRIENDHRGPKSELIHDSQSLEAGILALQARGFSRERILVVEYCAEPDADGLFRKFSAIRIGARIVPNHILVSRQWNVKGRDVPQHDALLDEELAYLHENPHADAVRDAFDTAGIDYGRIDYGFVGARMQVYEINTNPTLMGGGIPSDPRVLERKRFVSRALIEAFHAIDAPASRRRIRLDRARPVRFGDLL